MEKKICFNPVFPLIDLPQIKAVNLPLVYNISLDQYKTKKIENIEKEVKIALNKSIKIKKLSKGSTIAIAVGSRGISQIKEIISIIVTWLKHNEFKCFIIPAMGSHGGATREGQVKVLKSLGITEEIVGAQIKATMDVVDYGKTKYGVDCKFDKLAALSDGVIVVNRIKSHTSFSRPIESGLTKMVAVGLGNAEGAKNVHQLGMRGILEVLPDLAKIAIEKSPILYGIGLVENSKKELCIIEGVEPDDFLSTDKKLLKIAKKNLPKLPFSHLDVLIVENFGKNISGGGMDYAVTGRTDIRGIPNPSKPFIIKIGVLSLTEISNGNAGGIGVADFITHSMSKKINLYDMYVNAITSTTTEKIRIPMVLPNDLAVIKASILTCWNPNLDKIRFCIIHSTLNLDNILVSTALFNEIKKDDKDFTPPKSLKFTRTGKLLTKCS